MTERPSLARWVPYALGGAVIAVGLALGLWPRSPKPPPPAPSAAVTAPQPSASGSADEAPDEYVPDLSGPDVGEVIVAGAAEANGLALVDRRLVWLLTDGGTLGTARADGGDQILHASSSDAEAFGGVLAASSDGVFWSLERTDDEPEPLYFSPAAALAARAGAETPLATGASPDHLLAVGKTLYFTDLGNVMRLADGEVKTLVARKKRIATLTGDGAELFWFEVPYQGEGGHELWSLPAAGGTPKLIAGGLEPRERDLLALRRGTLYWAEGDERDKGILALTLPDGRPRRLLRAGDVTSLTIDDQDLVWAEVHGSDDAPVSILRAMSLGNGKVRRIGRDTGTVTALALDPDHFYWSGKSGIKRVTRKPAPDGKG